MSDYSIASSSVASTYDRPGAAAALSPKAGVARVLPISSIRFILATVVVLGHYGLPILQGHQHTWLLWATRSFINNAFNGPAAVIIFFVISGFCIHFPNRKGSKVNSWKVYYARRYLRILIPMTVAIALSIPLKMQFGIFTQSILWSLLCEEIYYLFYPALLIAHNGIGWRNLIIIAWVLSYFVVLRNPHALNYPSYGSALNWVLGLPCWLLGCTLAEEFDHLDPTPVSSRQIWAWRIGIYSLSVILFALGFHSALRPPWTLNPFAICGLYWLKQEIRYYRDSGRKPVLENLGEASYSIYLTHKHGPALLAAFPIAAALPPMLLWPIEMVLSFVFAVSFYWLVERPSHRFARAYAKRVARYEVVRKN